MTEQKVNLNERKIRERILGQRGMVVWLTGLSGAGKSTLARELEEKLSKRGRAAYVLDGDVLRSGMNRDLSFSEEDRHENIRRMGEVAALFADAGLICIVAAISPFRLDRAAARAACGDACFFEIFVDAPLSICEQRDTKGLYKLARAGKLKCFTGIDSPYESPNAPDLRIDSATSSRSECVDQIYALIDAQASPAKANEEEQ